MAWLTARRRIHPRATTTSNQKLCVGRSVVAYSVDYARRLSSANTALLLEFPFAAGPSHRVEGAQLDAVTSRATLFVTPSLRAQFVSHACAPPSHPWASDMDSAKKVAYCETELLTRGFIGTLRHRTSVEESTSAPGSDCCSRSASEASFGTSTR